MKDAMKLLVGYVIHEISPDLAECLCLSLVSLHACIGTEVGVVVFCREEIAAHLPQLGVNVCVVMRKEEEETLEQGAASHGIVTDHGGDALFLLEPTTLVLKDIVRDAAEMKALRVPEAPSESGVVINCLSVKSVDSRSDAIDRNALPLILTPSRDFGGRGGVYFRWICGYTYGFHLIGVNALDAIRGAHPGLCTTTGLAEMARALRRFQERAAKVPMGGLRPPRPPLLGRARGMGTTRGGQGVGQEGGPSITYYAVLLMGRPERVAMVDAMRESLPEGSLTVVEAVDGRKELDAATLSALTLSGFLRAPYHDEFVPHRPILVNTVASFMSHVRAIQRLHDDLERGGDADGVGVILEDDVKLMAPFNDTLVRMCEAVWPKGAAAGPDVVQAYVMPMQRMFVSPLVVYGEGRRSASSHVVLPSPESNWGMQCYAMRLEGAKKLLQGFKTMRGAADEQISRIEGLDLRCLVGPPILEEDNANAPSVTQATHEMAAPRTVKDVVYGLGGRS